MAELLAAGSHFLRWLFWGSLALVSYLSLVSIEGDGMFFSHQDKVSHAIAYLYFYSLGWRCFGHRQRPWHGRLFIGLVFYGVAIEVLQGLGGTRYMELLDLAANVTGLCLGLAVVALFIRCNNRQASDLQ